MLKMSWSHNHFLNDFLEERVRKLEKSFEEKFQSISILVE